MVYNILSNALQWRYVLWMVAKSYQLVDDFYPYNPIIDSVS